jgi:glycerophosphoryl diester phosphodiesterase
MPKLILMIIVHTVIVSSFCKAQGNENDNIYLTSYLIPGDGGTIGYVKIKQGEIRDVTATGPQSDVIKISKDHQLSIRRNRLAPNAFWFDITLVINASSGQMTKTFRLVKNDFLRNKVIAHRGAWKNTGAPENSIAALKQAIALGCEGSEFDVHMSADSVPVINHDPAIQDISIAKTQSAQLRLIKLSNGETLPTLEQYLNAGMAQNRTKLILEIKPSEIGKDASIRLARRVVSLVEQLKMEGWVDYISFDYDVCKEVIRIAPYARVAYLKGDKTPGQLAADGFFGLDYHYNILQKNAEWASEAKALKLTVNVWTVNERRMLEELLLKPVDFITTNEPELLLSLLKESALR